ncbi:MAG: hypothetical protein ABI627_19240 [Polyangiaceae bacterium]
MLRSVEMVLRSLRGWLVGAALFASLGGCLSPTLPLPPPSDPMVSSVSDGLVRFTGVVEAESEVFALDRNTNVIAGQYTHSGQYDFTLAAKEQDAISLWYIHGTVESPPNEFNLKIPAATP